MDKIIIHLSDIHYRRGWEEEQGVVLDTFLKDLEKQVKQLDSSSIYVVFSGDIIQAGEETVLYEEFFRQFNDYLERINIPKEHRICIPGNHDISRKYISENKKDHEGILSLNMDEKSFNDYIKNQCHLTQKFNNYKAFEVKFSSMGVTNGTTVTGAGWNIDENIGVYCLNTALCSSGGLEEINDKGRLAIDTRSLHSWNLSCSAKTKILVMHHPIDWLTPWSQKELQIILSKDFSLCLTGHNHDQSMFHSINQNMSLIECSAPPLFTSKHDDLGYAIISISPDTGVTEIEYRQWTKHRSFVAGVNFSNTDGGRVSFLDPAECTKKFVDPHLNNKLDEALRAFSSQPKLWVNPTLCKHDESTKDPEAKTEPPINLSEFISTPKSTVIKAPPQFGLTCLARHLALEAWRSQESNYWLHLDSSSLKPHSLEKTAQSELSLLGFEMSDVKCVILDSWVSHEKDSHRILEKTCALFKDVPVLVMQTIDDTSFMDELDATQTDCHFDVLYLWALPRGHIRKVVNGYINAKPIGDEDKVLIKVVSDLEVLNLHRTPLNCLTLLKVSEIDFDESPVNRTEMIKRVLFLLFNVDDIPTYKVRPDLKDCEYVLGRFCETMLREKRHTFTSEGFLSELQAFCEERVIDLDVQVVFDVLFSNNILIKDGNLFRFRFSYWVFYFSAQRMHQDASFAKFIHEDMRYVNYPEIIEFYTGIDRSREDTLKVLINDIKNTCDLVDTKCGLPDGLNPYNDALWNPSEEVIKKMQSEIGDSVKSSNLPDAVKDEYADRLYDKAKPYDQSIQKFFLDYSLVVLMHAVKAGSRALRNSDYVDPTVKRELLDLLMRCWEKISQVMLVLAPILANRGQAVFDGACFVLTGCFGTSSDKRFNAVLNCIPSNVVSWFEDDLYSRKMGPLLINHFNDEENELRKHELLLMLISQRPRGWEVHVKKQITSLQKNSFYLYDVYHSLRKQYRYSYASKSTLKDIKYLIKMSVAKHELGMKSPSNKVVNKLPDKLLPPRFIDQADID